jgi:hypothetical protein
MEASRNFLNNLVALRDFETGSGWEATIRGLVRKKYRQDLEGLARLHPPTLARLLKGEILPEQPYATIQWVLRLIPFRPLELFLFFDLDPEFGPDLRVFYARKSLVVPTEDAYVFAWDYVALLARYARGKYPLEDAVPASEWMPLNTLIEGADRGADYSLGVREELLPLITPEVAEVAVRRLDCGTFARQGPAWEVVFPILGDLSLRLQISSGVVAVAVDRHGAQKYPPEFLMSFSWLYVNALIRESRQVDPGLPRLSRYL